MTHHIDRTVEVLTRTPGVLRALLAGLDGSWIHGRYGDGTFSPFDVVGHLIHGERADWISRVGTILEHGEDRPFEPFDRFAMFEASQGKSVDELLDTFEALRAANLESLAALRLSSQDLDRRGTHPELGPVTLGQLLATWAVHDLNHIGQIAEAMAFQYGTLVGPWRAYLTIPGTKSEEA